MILFWALPKRKGWQEIEGFLQHGVCLRERLYTQILGERLRERDEPADSPSKSCQAIQTNEETAISTKPLGGDPGGASFSGTLSGDDSIRDAWWRAPTGEQPGERPSFSPAQALCSAPVAQADGFAPRLAAPCGQPLCATFRDGDRQAGTRPWPSC